MNNVLLLVGFFVLVKSISIWVLSGQVIRPFVLIIAILLLFSPFRCLALTEADEPPLSYTLILNGEEHEVYENVAMTINGVFNAPEVYLKASKTRFFIYGDVAFKYPASFTWDADILSSGEKTWTLAGDDFSIMYVIVP